MTATSQWGRKISVNSGNRIDAPKPVDPYIGQIALNNITHYADMSGQVRVAWARDNGKISSAPAYPFRHQADGGTATAASRVLTFVFPMTIKSDGTPYPLRVRLAAHIASGGLGDTPTYELVWSAFSAADRERSNQGASSSGGNYASAQTTSVTSAWVISDLFTMSASAAAECRQTISSVSAISGGTENTVDIYMSALTVYVDTPLNPEEYHVDAVYAAEFVG